MEQTNRCTSRITRAGFTLLELSIVLVIIGLVIGGILVGRDLIIASQLRAHISQMERFNSATNTFKLKYNCLAGDCPNATNFGFTDNGNNNGLVSGAINGCNAVNAESVAQSGCPMFGFFNRIGISTEPRFFLSHLQTSGLLQEKLMTIATSDNSYSLALPESFDKTAIAVIAWNGKHYFKSGISGFHAAWTTMGLATYRNNFTPAEAAHIHSKLGGGTITLGGNAGAPNALLAGDKVITTNDRVGDEGYYWNTATAGASGADSDVCINTSVTPPVFNVANPKKLCGLIIQAGF